MAPSSLPLTAFRRPVSLMFVPECSTFQHPVRSRTKPTRVMSSYKVELFLRADALHAHTGNVGSLSSRDLYDGVSVQWCELYVWFKTDNATVFEIKDMLPINLENPSYFTALKLLVLNTVVGYVIHHCNAHRTGKYCVIRKLARARVTSQN